MSKKKIQNMQIEPSQKIATTKCTNSCRPRARRRRFHGGASISVTSAKRNLKSTCLLLVPTLLLLFVSGLASNLSPNGSQQFVTASNAIQCK